MSTPAKRLLTHVLSLGAILTVWLSPVAPRAAQAADTSKWETEISAFEASDKTNPPPKGAILFVGSSSIRLWKTLASDFPQHRVLNRGFGGSQVADSTALADRIIVPYRPRQVVLYAGDNDIAGGKTAEQVAADFKAFVKKVRGALPDLPITFISIKPSPSRWHLADKVKAANRLIEEYVRTETGLAFIDVFAPMLAANGEPRPEIFGPDKLHMNAQGYALWKSIIGPHLSPAPR